MERLLRFFKGSSKPSTTATKVSVSIENCVILDGSQIFIELCNNKNEKLTLDDSEKSLYTEDLELLVVNVYKSDYSLIGSKNLELMKKIYYYDIYSLINSKQIEFHSLVEFTNIRFQVLVKLVFSEQLKNQMKKQRFRPTVNQSKWYSCFQACNKCSEVNLN